MKHIKKIALLGLGLFLFGGAGLAVASVTTNDWKTYEEVASSSHFKFEEKQRVTNSSEGVNITTDLHETEIQIERGTGKDIEIEYNYNDEKHPIEVKETSDGVKITRKEKFFNISHFFNINQELGKVTVKVPETYNGELNIKTTNHPIHVTNIGTEKLHAKTSNAKVRLDGVVSKSDMVIKTTNAKVQLKSVEVQNGVSVKTTNASVALNNFNTKELLTIESTNGPIVMDKVEAKEVTGGTTNSHLDINQLTIQGNMFLSSSNGRIKAEHLSSRGEVMIRTTNASVFINDVKAPRVAIETTNSSIESKDIYAQNVELHSTNGDIILTNMENPNFKIDILNTYTTNGSEVINAMYNQKVK